MDTNEDRKLVGRQYGFASDEEAVAYPMTLEERRRWSMPNQHVSMLAFDLIGMFEDDDRVISVEEEIEDDTSLWTGEQPDEIPQAS